jgi:hypothetical protein
MWCRFSRWVRRYKSIMYVANVLKDISIMITPSRHVSTTIWIVHINMTRWHMNGNMRSIYHIGIIRLRSGQIIYVLYLWVRVEGWYDGVVVVDPYPIMSHGRRRLIPQWSRQNVLTYETNRNRKPLFKTIEIGLSSFVRIDDSQGRCRASVRCSSSNQVTSIRWRGMNHDNFGGCGGK